MSGRTRGGTDEIFSPYFDPKADDTPMPASVYMDIIDATEAERAIIAEGVEAAKLVEADKQRRLSDKKRHSTLGGAYEGPTPASVVDAVEMHWRRRITLLTAIARLGKEQGVTFNVESWDYYHNKRRYRRVA